MLNKAIEIAVHAHDGQFDKAGEPYILHPLRVMLAQTTELERICAVMHDVVEDSEFTFSDLRSIGFSEEAIIVLDFLTKRNAESYDDFIDRVLLNETACHVKLADLEDNMNLSRVKNPTQEDFERVEKYRSAKQKILNVLETLPLRSVPGMREEILERLHTPIDECLAEDKVNW